MKRGVVVSIDKKHAVVMTADGQFVRAPIQGSPEIGEEIAFEDEIARPRRLNRSIYRYAGAAAMLCILLFAGLAYSLIGSNPVVAYLTIDINPSVEIGVDKDERVRELRALNEDGEKIIAGIRYKAVKVERVAASILEEARKTHYLDSTHEDIFIASMVLGGQEQLDTDFESVMTKKLDRELQSWLTDHSSTTSKISITTLAIPEELREEADANGISAGKFAAYLVAKNEGYDLTLEKMKDQSIDSIMEPIGGVKKNVENKDDISTKQMLQQLLAEEIENKGKEKSVKPTDNGSAEQPTKKPTTPPTANPSLKPTLKPTPKPTPRPTTKPSQHHGGNDRDEDDDDHDYDEKDDDDNDNRGNSGWKGNKDRDKDTNVSKDKHNHSKDKSVKPTGKPKDSSNESKDDDDRDDDRDNDGDDDRNDERDKDNDNNDRDEDVDDNDRDEDDNNDRNKDDDERKNDNDDDKNNERDDDDDETHSDDEKKHNSGQKGEGGVDHRERDDDDDDKRDENHEHERNDEGDGSDNDDDSEKDRD